MLWTTLTKQNNTKKNMIKKSFFQQCANQFCWKHLTVREFVLESNNISPTSLYSVENVFHFFLKLNFKLLHHCKFHEVSMVLGSRSRQPDWADKSKGITQFPGFLFQCFTVLANTENRMYHLNLSPFELKTLREHSWYFMPALLLSRNTKR